MSIEDAKPCPKCNRLKIKRVIKKNDKEMAFWFCEVCDRKPE